MSAHPFDNEYPTYVLVVEDAVETQLMIQLRLQKESYDVRVASTGEEALEIMRHDGLPDLVILDIVLPGMDGFAVAQEIRQMGDIPIIFLSALTDTTTKVEGLNRYAEDYITKPFIFAELLARMRRVLLRSAAHRPADLESVIDERLRANFPQQYVLVDGKKLDLTPMENRLLHVLFKNRGRVLSAKFLLEKGWEATESGTLGSLWVHVRRLRKKIEPDAKHPRYLVTVRGQGYCLPNPIQPSE
ncbi:MAG: response regulator transcription factor [Caldilineaceae bacterium]|nr:response regulator transcription factor [Caldilineaceae bacterium]